MSAREERYLRIKHELTELSHNRTEVGVSIFFNRQLGVNVLAMCECISGTDLLRQVYVLPH